VARTLRYDESSSSICSTASCPRARRAVRHPALITIALPAASTTASQPAPIAATTTAAPSPTRRRTIRVASREVSTVSNVIESSRPRRRAEWIASVAPRRAPAAMPLASESAPTMTAICCATGEPVARQPDAKTIATISRSIVLTRLLAQCGDQPTSAGRLRTQWPGARAGRARWQRLPCDANIRSAVTVTRRWA